MRKTYIIFTLTFIFLFGIGIASAEVSNSSNIDTAGVRADMPIKDRIRSTIQTATQNVGTNETLRNRILASTTKAREDIRDTRQEDLRDLRSDAVENRRNASSTEARKEIMKNMKLDAFKIKQNALVRQLQLSISNLEQVTARISARIDKAVTEGRNMSTAKTLLSEATTKLNNAKTAIQTLAAYVPTVPSTATSTQVDLAKPRQVGDTAIKAVKDARDALNKVVQAIAHSMGLGRQATSTPANTTNNQ